MTTDSILTMLDEKLNQTGKGEEFFRVAQQELVRDIVEVISPIWPTTMLIKLRKLVADPVHMRAICVVIRDEVHSRSAESVETDNPELDFVKSRLQKLHPEQRHVVMAAALRFLKSTDSQAGIDWTRNIGAGIMAVLAS